MFNYENKGDILYQVENYRFRLKGIHVADIDLLYFLDDDQYAYEFELEQCFLVSSTSGYEKRTSSADLDLQKRLKIDQQSVFKEKQEALQHAIDVVTAVIKEIDNE
mgnify:CR=1 FL=1